jgi:prepilin-type N-terminal cleavage/methylation domain-containing protein
MNRARRRGFTLLELLVALTLTGIATALAATALSAARGARESQLQAGARNQADAQLRSLLIDMLRHAPPAASIEAPLLDLAATPDGPRLEFMSTGVREPFGVGEIWRVVIRRVGDSLQLRAHPLRAASFHAPLAITLPNVTALAIEVQEVGRRGDVAPWRTDWPLRQQRPGAIRLQWRQGRSSASAATPLLVALAPLESTS